MELTKWPETEFEYWSTIETLGAFRHGMNRQLSHGRIEDPQGGVAKDVDDAIRISTQLVQELGEKFGILYEGHPRQDVEGKFSPAPEGKRWYWPWYHEMRSEWLKGEYNKIICSACPLGEGAEHCGSRVPCSVFPGSLYQLRVPHLCAMLERDWTRDQLFAEIREKGGEEAVANFLAKEKELQSIPKEGVPA